MSSCLYECEVMHRRLKPKVHGFQYRIFFFYLELAEIDRLTEEIPFFSRNRWNAFSFHDRDHFEGGAGQVTEKLRAFLATQGISLPQNPQVHLLTLVRVFGYVFNPVAFYFCQKEDGEPICAVAEVGNTFGEKKLFLVPHAGGDFYKLIVPKHFYVSPFSDLELQFEFKLHRPNEKLEIYINDRAGDELVLLSTLSGRRAELTPARLAWFAVKYPLVTAKVIFSIHWEAFRLWLKRLPFHRKALHPELQRQVLRPHSSLSQQP